MGTKGVTQAGIPFRDCSSRGRKEHWFHVSSASDEQSNYAALCYVKVAKKKQTKNKQTPKHFYLRPLIDVNHMAKSRREMVHLIRRQGASANEWLNFCVVIGPCHFWLFCTITKRVFLRTVSPYVFFFSFFQCIWFVFGETTGLNVQFAVMRSK